MDTMTTNPVAAATATEVLQARMRDAEQTQELLQLLTLPFDKRVDKANAISRGALWRWSDQIGTAIEELPEGDWRASLLGERKALIDAVTDALEVLDN